MKTLLVLAAHTDDEIACAGSISKFIRNGYEVFCVAFSIAEESVPSQFPKDILIKEFNDSLNALNIKENNRKIFRYKVRNFYSVRQEILEDLCNLKDRINPDIIFTSSSFDTHQDHEVICNESKRAFKKSSIFGYETLKNNFSFNTDIFISLTEDDVRKKLMCGSAYKSQKQRKHTEEIRLNLLKIRGFMIGVEYAEAFECIRFIDY